MQSFSFMSTALSSRQFLVACEHEVEINLVILSSRRKSMGREVQMSVSSKATCSIIVNKFEHLVEDVRISGGICCVDGMPLGYFSESYNLSWLEFVWFMVGLFLALTG